MIERRIPVGYYVKITPSNVDNAKSILYKGHGYSNISPRCFIERIKKVVSRDGYTYVRREEDEVYSYSDTIDDYKPYKTLGELE